MKIAPCHDQLRNELCPWGIGPAMGAPFMRFLSEADARAFFKTLPHGYMAGWQVYNYTPKPAVV